MTTTTLRPNGDGTPLQWTPTPGGTHYTTVDDDPDTPDDGDYIEDAVTGNRDVLALNDSPADYGGLNSATLKVRGRASADRGFVAELRKADETVLATVTFVTGVDTALTVKSAVYNGALTKAEVDGLKVEFRTTV